MDEIPSLNQWRRNVEPDLCSVCLPAIAFLLAIVGIYGVMSYSVTQRHTQNSVFAWQSARSPRDVFPHGDLGQGMALALIGVAFGLVGAFALTRLMASMLFGVGPTDPATFASIALLLTGVALIACYIPSRRATKVDHGGVVALRVGQNHLR